MFWCKTFSVKGEFLVAICDEELIGKKIGKKLKVEVKKEFYGGELVDEEKAVDLMEKATIGNLLGKRIIELAIEKKFITRENVIFIDDIPHAQFLG